VLCVIDGPTRGRCRAATAAPAELRANGWRATSSSASSRHTDLGSTSTYLQGNVPTEIIHAVRSRHQPTISATAGLTL
jgi:hypothetical protein